MMERIGSETRSKQTRDPITWLMVFLSLLFILLYLSALLGWLRPLSDITMITRLEPIIFLIIGFYFGRVPAQQQERNLRLESERMQKKLESAQLVKEQMIAEREAIEEKIRNARVALRSEILEVTAERTPASAGYDAKGEDTRTPGRALETALSILNS